MCGRYALYTETEQWSEEGIVWPLDEDFAWSPSYNVAPTTHAPVVLNLDRPMVTLHRWGLVPGWARDAAMGNRMINARAETLAERPAFRTAFRQRRCLVLADGFYEWQRRGRQKTPFYIRHRSGRILGFAGLWERWKTPEGDWLKTFTIITTEPNRLLAPIHDRMPVIVPAQGYSRWLDPEPGDPGSLSGLLAPYPDQELEAFEVSRLVNNPANNTAECIRPLSSALA